jgi:hypothetical protein
VDCRHAVDECVGSAFDGTVASDAGGGYDRTVETSLPLEANVVSIEVCDMVRR